MATLGAGQRDVIGQRGSHRGSGLVVDDKRDHHVDLELRDRTLLDPHMLLLDPRTSHVAKRLVRPADPLLDGILEALG